MTSDLRQPPAVIGPDHQLPPHAAEVPPHVRDRRPSRLLWAVAGLLLLGVIVLVARAWHGRKPAAPPAPEIVVTTTVAREGEIGVHLEAIGTVTSLHTASISSQVTGQIVAVHYLEGQRVEAADPLVDIDARPYRAQLLQAQGMLERDQNLLAQAEMDLERYRAAWARNAIAKQQLDDQEKIVEQDKGTVKNDLGTVKYNQVQVSFCHIVAPFAGRIGLRLVDPGNIVQAGSNVTLAVVTQLRPTTVVFTISEDNLTAVRQQMAAGGALPVDALDRTAQRPIARGTLSSLDSQIDTTTGTVKARALFPNADELLFPNQFVNTRLLVRTLRDVVLVPASAVQQNGPESFVYVIANEVARLRKVKVGVTDDGTTQVEGVQPGEVVADSGFDRLHDGAAVTISAAPPAASSSTDGGAP